MSGSAVKNHGWPKCVRQSYAKRTISYLLSFHGYQPILEAFRLQHRHCRIRLQQFQLKNEVTNLPQETGADHPQKPKTKRGMTIEIRTTVCEIFLNGWSSSQTIWRTQKCLCPHTFLRTQIRNVLRKWYQNQGSTVFFLSSPKVRKLRSLPENQNDKGSLQKTHCRSSTSCRKVWWLDNGWPQCPQWGMWIKRQSPVRCRGTKSCHSMDSTLSVQNKDFILDGKSLL